MGSLNPFANLYGLQVIPKNFNFFPALNLLYSSFSVCFLSLLNTFMKHPVYISHCFAGSRKALLQYSC